MDPTTGSATNATGGASGGQTGLDQAMVNAISAAVQTAVSQATAQMQAQLQSLTEDIKKVSDDTSTDTDSATVSRSSIDPADSQRKVETYGQMALADCIEFRKGCDALILRKISQDTDHHGAIPPIAPRSATGPGTTLS